MLDELINVPVLVLLWSLIDWQICASVSPCQIMGVFAGGRPQLGAPVANVLQLDCGLDDRCRISRQSLRDPSGPRRTFMVCGCPSSPCRGKSPCE